VGFLGFWSLERLRCVEMRWGYSTGLADVPASNSWGLEPEYNKMGTPIL
jgi:hypothetical protein